MQCKEAGSNPGLPGHKWKSYHYARHALQNYGIMCKDIFFLLFRWFCIMVEDLAAWLTIDIALKPQLNSPIGLGASVFLFNIL
jgi:hypothetical protein